MTDLRKTAQDLRDTATWLNGAAEELDRQGVEMEKVMPLLKAISNFATPMLPTAPVHPPVKPTAAKEAESRRPGMPR